ncbi:MAG: chorismate-binding protein [Acidimicrobiales bacterium]
MCRRRGVFGNSELSLVPDRDSFGRGAQTPGAAHTTVVRAVIPTGDITPVTAFSVLRRRPGAAFLFESVAHDEDRDRWTFLGCGGAPVVDWSFGRDLGDPYDEMRRELATREHVSDDGAPPFVSGLVGFLSYETAHLIEPRVPVLSSPEGFPDALFVRCAVIVAFDHRLEVVHVTVESRIEPSGDFDAAYAAAAGDIESVIHEIRAAATASGSAGPFATSSGPATVLPERPASEFESAVARAKAYIEAGDCQQIVVSQRFRTELAIDPLAIYEVLRQLNPSPYLFYFEHGELALVGSSPEALARIRDRQIVVRPIAGTRPRGTGPIEDERLVAELLADPKENAEHVMLVDLARNDVGRVAEIGTVRVDLFRTVEKYSHVMHLVSQVRGRLVESVDAIEALRAVFPAGTVTGAPKVRAMEIIAELEGRGRGPYAGCVGYIGDDGNMDMAIVIRTLVCNAGALTVQAGAGVVYNSDPVTEQAETVHKANALLAAVAAAQGRADGGGRP